MPKVLYLITEDWFFCSHFLERAVAAKAAGYDVVIVTRESAHGDQIRQAGLRLVPISIHRRGLNPIRELGTLLALWRIYRRERPDLMHHIALKPIFYGAFIARCLGLGCFVNAPVGMGFVFSSRSLLARSLRPFVRLAMRFLLNPVGSKVVFENEDDQYDAIASGLVRSSDALLIRGAGIDIQAYQPASEPKGLVSVVLVARMLWDKGIGEYVEAARILRKKNVQARLLLVGAPDADNPAAIPEKQLMQWNTEGIVEWLGHRDDIPEILSTSHIVCLPSYREGLPKSLLEGLAAGKPIVTTDVPGCREVVENGINGILVPPKQAPALADALATLISNPSMRQDFGAKGRVRAEREFASTRVIDATLALYRQFPSVQSK